MKAAPALLFSATVALVLVAFDTRAAAPFDAPKRLVAMLGIAGAMGAWAFAREAPAQAWRHTQKVIVLCVAGAFVLALLSAMLSPQRAAALDALRTMALFALVPLLCATQERVWPWAATAFVAGAAINAGVSVMQAASLAQPFHYGTAGGRGAALAMIGNSGVLGLVAAFALLLFLPRLTRESYGRWFVAALLLAAMLVNRSVTPFVALAAGLLVYAPRLLRRTAAAAMFVLCFVAATDAAHRIDALLSYRLGPWKAAVSMTAARPLLGYGPGTYGSQYAAHAGARFTNPHLAGSYAQAHNEVLQALAELGVPATLLLITAFVLLLRGARREPLVFSILIAGVIASLTWFPLQRPETALLLLAACGRAWRHA